MNCQQHTFVFTFSPRIRVLRRIKCQRLTADKTYEEAEIEVPAPVFKKLEGREEVRKGTWDWGLPETLGTRIGGLFSRTAQ